MNADLQKLRDSRLFRNLPDRAFDRILKYIKVRYFESGEKVLDLRQDGGMQRSFGYLVSGRVLFIGDNERPLGLAVSDEFFLGRAFSVRDLPVRELISASSQSLLVWIPKEIIEILASNSEMFADIIEDIYESIYERAELMASDIKGAKHYKDWLSSQDMNKTLSVWLGQLEKRRFDRLKRLEKEKKNKNVLRLLWFSGAIAVILVAMESLGRFFHYPINPSYYLTGTYGKYDPGSKYNIAIGIIGYSLIVFTFLHGFFKWAIRRLKWKINYKLSSQFHIYCGIVGSIFILFHTAFHFKGANVAYYALYALVLGFMSGLIGQLISNQIPKSIRGEKIKLDGLKKEQQKLRQKAELLMDDRQYHTSIAMISESPKRSLWGIILFAPFLWLQSMKIKRSLQGLGLGKDSASLAAELVRREFQLRQKIRTLEIANVFFKRWMLIHKPMGYVIYTLGAIHILLAMVLA